MSTKVEEKKLADEITDYLFTSGAGNKVQRLVLEMEDGKNCGGWCREAVRDAIQRIVDARQPKRVKRQAASDIHRG